jgi:hypothetical protein
MKNQGGIYVSPEIVDHDLNCLYTFIVSHTLKVEIKLQFEYELCHVYLNTIQQNLLPMFGNILVFQLKIRKTIMFFKFFEIMFMFLWVS